MPLSAVSRGANRLQKAISAGLALPTNWGCCKTGISHSWIALKTSFRPFDTALWWLLKRPLFICIHKCSVLAAACATAVQVATLQGSITFAAFLHSILFLLQSMFIVTDITPMTRFPYFEIFPSYNYSSAAAFYLATATCACWCCAPTSEISLSLLQTYLCFLSHVMHVKTVAKMSYGLLQRLAM